MQLSAITRKSALMAILLLVAILFAAALRARFTPFGVEMADSPYADRTISFVLAMLLFLFGGFVEGKILPRSGLSKSYCTLPIPLYGLLSCGIVLSPNTLSTATMSLCFALSMYLLLRSLHTAGEKDSVFFASILLGATALLYPPCIVLVAVLPLSVFVLALSPRQALLMVVGYILPLFAASYVVWYGGDSFLQFARNFIVALAMDGMGDIDQIPWMSIAMTVVVVVVLAMGSIYAMFRPDKRFGMVRTRRSLNLFVWVQLLTLSILFMPSCDLSAAAIIAVPLAILLSFMLDILPNNLSTISYWVLLALFVLHLFVE